MPVLPPPTAPTVAPDRPRSRGRRRPGRWIAATAGAVALVVLLLLVVAWVGIWVFHAREARPQPQFPSLVATPDPTLAGTVAYYASDTGCVRLIAASGAESRDLYCIPREDVDVWVAEGKPAGPQLVWRSDGRLEITMFRMQPNEDTKSAPTLGPGWQRIVDPRTGAVEEVPATQVPSTPLRRAGPTTDPAGRTVRVGFDPTTGKGAVTMEADGTTRTLLSVHGPGEYGYSFGPASWSPTWDWIAVADPGRILVVTPTHPARTRVLVTGAGGGAGGGTAGPEFAVTAEQLVEP